MTGTSYDTSARSVRPYGQDVARWDRRGNAWLAAVAVAFTVAQLVLVRPGMGLGWDESVYVSQVSGHAPAAFFSAPRARGTSLLVAPVATWSSSTALLRVYLAVLAGAGLFLALRAWRGLLAPRVVVLGGALFASLWVTLYYGPQAMPNLWVALAALAAVGCFLRAQVDRGRPGPLWGLAAGAALMALMRPTDAAWVCLPLLVAAVAVRPWRRLWPLLALLGGLAAGAAEWVIEAFVSYGGLARRLSDGSRIQGGLGWHNAVSDQLRSLSGRTLCRPCTGAMPNTAVTLWWYVLPVLAVLALALAVRARRPAATALLCACAATAAFPYLFLIGYAAPRFLLPAYALLSLPVAEALIFLVAAERGRLRPLAVTAVAVGLAGHLAIQTVVLERLVDRTTTGHHRWSQVAVALHEHGVRPPCVVTGGAETAPAIPVAFYAGCASADTGGHNENTTAAALVSTARRMPVAFVTEGGDPPHYARGWQRVRLAGQVYAYVAP
ncbi:hypothetical protein ABZ619_08370 [Streptomyces sp. NPDC007851]|uniref:hypothetical protein n=1 Tax=Streptomyces sp. NPDC007851 TaxID=3155008 RepID=UPI0033C7555C